MTFLGRLFGTAQPGWAKRLPPHLRPRIDQIEQLELLRNRIQASEEEFSIHILGHPATTRRLQFHLYHELNRQQPHLSHEELLAALVLSRLQSSLSMGQTFFNLSRCSKDELPKRVSKIVREAVNLDGLVNLFIQEESRYSIPPRSGLEWASAEVSRILGEQPEGKAQHTSTSSSDGKKKITLDELVEGAMALMGMGAKERLPKLIRALGTYASAEERRGEVETEYIVAQMFAAKFAAEIMLPDWQKKIHDSMREHFRELYKTTGVNAEEIDNFLQLRFNEYESSLKDESGGGPAFHIGMKLCGNISGREISELDASTQASIFFFAEVTAFKTLFGQVIVVEDKK